MGKKNKILQPNAPELPESSLFRQPPRNPYYPDLETSSALLPPPPYSDLSVTDQHNYNPRMVPNIAPLPSANYARFSNQSVRGSPATVIIQQQQPHYVDRRMEKQHRNVRKFNNQMLVLALIVVLSTIYAHSLYSQRPCLDFLVHSPAKDVSITVYMVRNMHLHVAYGSIFVFLLCMAKCMSGESRSYSCYLTIMGLTTFIGTIYTGYLAYLAFYSPCSLKVGELAANTFKTLVGSISDNMPPPQRKIFGESSVFDLANEDKAGVWIFLMDLCNFIVYLSGFISATSLC